MVSEPHDLAFDYEYDDDPDDCDCSEYEVDFEGRAECPGCGRRWWLSPEQLEAYDEARAIGEAKWAEFDRRERWARLWQTVSWHLWRRWFPKCPVIDDDIPF